MQKSSWQRGRFIFVSLERALGLRWAGNGSSRRMLLPVEGAAKPRFQGIKHSTFQLPVICGGCWMTAKGLPKSTGCWRVYKEKQGTPPSASLSHAAHHVPQLAGSVSTVSKVWALMLALPVSKARDLVQPPTKRCEELEE